ncbi:MAG: STAS domain-containing protein [Cyanosarcina radialis HA8281-LM2]|jgi:anti-anti-sigma factor|nr:STAS domain-containing protein [Cyanosarcina radialis HA8281-LM2]
MTLQISPVFLDRNTMHLALNGKLDSITAPKLEEFINQGLDRAIETLIVDLEQLSFISSAGLRIFAKTRKLMKSREGKICFVNLSPQVKKVFDIVKAVPLSEVFQDPKELDAYLASIQKQAGE